MTNMFDNVKFQAVLDAANALDRAMQDYEAFLLSAPNADATRQAKDFAITRTHVQKMLGVVQRKDSPTTTRFEPPLAVASPVQAVASLAVVVEDAAIVGRRNRGRGRGKR